MPGIPSTRRYSFILGKLIPHDAGGCSLSESDIAMKWSDCERWSQTAAAAGLLQLTRVHLRFCDGLIWK